MREIERRYKGCREGGGVVRLGGQLQLNLFVIFELGIKNNRNGFRTSVDEVKVVEVKEFSFDSMKYLLDVIYGAVDILDCHDWDILLEILKISDFYIIKVRNCLIYSDGNFPHP